MKPSCPLLQNSQVGIFVVPNDQPGQRAQERCQLIIVLTLLKAHWTLIKDNQYKGNIMRIRPNKESNINIPTADIEKTRNNVLAILKKGKIPMPSLLYGYVPGRDQLDANGSH